MNIGSKGLVEFMRARADRQRTILYSLKFPDEDERASQGGYYSTAKGHILTYHRESHTPEWLISQAGAIDKKAQASANHRETTRLRANARSLRDYSRHFGNRTFVIQHPARFRLRLGQVAISISPELHVMQGNRPQLIKLEFAPKLMPDESVRLFLQLIAHAASMNESNVKPTQCMLYHVPTGSVYRASGVGRRFLNELKAACQTIEDIWERLSKRVA